MATREVPYLIADRTISGRGVVKVPPSDAYRAFYVYINVVRLSSNASLSSKYNPDKSDYAKLTWMRGDYVLRENTVSYSDQQFDWICDPAGYLASYLVCAFGEISAYLDYLAPYVQAPPLVTSITKRLYVEPLRDVPDAIRIVCLGGTAVVVRLYGLNYDIGCLAATPSPKLPPDPVPIAMVPIGTSVAVSPPYISPNDDGNTIPLSIDDIGTPVPVSIRITYLIDIGYSNDTSSYSVDLTFTVPDSTYSPVMRDGATPGSCPGHISPQFTYAVSPGKTDVLLFTHSTCNLVSIASVAPA